MIKTLLSHYHRGAENTLLRRLPADEMDAILREEGAEGNPAALAVDPAQFFGKLHYSWLQQPLKRLPEVLMAPVIAALSEQQRQNAQSFFNIPAPASPAAPRVRQHLLNTLYNQLEDKPSLPAEMLPQNILSPLLELNKAQLTELVDLLAMYDLSDKIQRIVDKNKLKLIYSCLSPKQQKYLNTLLRRPHKVRLVEIDLKQWNDDPATLRNILHKRGLLRLAAAISGQHPDFIWYLTHHLDTGRAIVIRKHVSEAEIPVYTAALAEQLLDTLNTLQTESIP
jgi:hypothetical protein